MEFAWQAPDSCPAAYDVLGRIEHRFGAPVDASLSGISVEISREVAGFVARIDVRDAVIANRTRTLTSARCDELADAVAVIVARLASEVREARQLRDHDARESPHGIKFAWPSEAASASTSWGGGVRALALSGIGTLPRIGVGGELAVYLRRGSYFGEVGAARWGSSPQYLVNGAPGRVEVGLDAIALRGGWTPGARPLRGWLGLEAGKMTGSGVYLFEPQVGTAWWVAATSGVSVGWPMGEHARLVGTFEAVVPIHQISFILVDGTEMYRPAAVSARCALGIEVGWL
ncbi:MAG: hypothetical protein ACTHU0_04535 [Kofleriaceae bacterium]